MNWYTSVQQISVQGGLIYKDLMQRKSDRHCSFNHVKSLFFMMNFLVFSRKSSCIFFIRHKLPEKIMTCDTKPDRLLTRAEPELLATYKWQPLPLAVERLLVTPTISCLPPTLLVSVWQSATCKTKSGYPLVWHCRCNTRWVTQQLL